MKKEEINEVENEEDHDDLVDQEEETNQSASEEKAQDAKNALFLSNKFQGPFKEIVNYLISFAEGDPLFKKKLEESTQTEEDFKNYLISRAKKLAVGNVAMVSDQDVFDWAVHFIDENIRDVKGSVATVTKAQESKPKEKSNHGSKESKVKEEKTSKFNPRPAGLDSSRPTLFDFAD